MTSTTTKASTKTPPPPTPTKAPVPAPSGPTTNGVGADPGGIQSVFAAYQQEAYPYRFRGEITVLRLVGGTPLNDDVAGAWLRTKTAATDELIRDEIAQIMTEQKVTVEEATRIANEQRHVNGFRRDLSRQGQLYIEGRQLKAALKEAISVACAADKLKAKGWGKTNKGILSFFAEHAFVEEDKLHLYNAEPNEYGLKANTPILEPHRLMQGFVSTWRGTGIKYEQVVEPAKFRFTVYTDYDFTDEDWRTIWLCGENQGIGASRSQGHGRYRVTGWKRIGL